MKGWSWIVRHVSRTHRVALDWLFDRLNLYPRSKSNMLTPKTNSQTVYWRKFYAWWMVQSSSSVQHHEFLCVLSQPFSFSWQGVHSTPSAHTFFSCAQLVSVCCPGSSCRRHSFNILLGSRWSLAHCALSKSVHTISRHVIHCTFWWAAHLHLAQALLPFPRHDLPQLPLTSFPAHVSIGHLAEPTTFTKGNHHVEENWRKEDGRRTCASQAEVSLFDFMRPEPRANLVLWSGCF